jgi:hypothetical protein
MAMFHLRRGDYLVSGIAAGLLSATRANGIFFLLFALAILVRHDGLQSFVTPWRAPQKFVPLLLAPAGLFLFWGFCFATTGDAFAQVSTAKHGWYWQYAPFWENVPVMLRAGGAPMWAAVTGLCALACALLLLREKLHEEFILCVALIALVLGGTGVVSVFRYWIVLFPIWIGVAKAISGRPWRARIRGHGRADCRSHLRVGAANVDRAMTPSWRRWLLLVLLLLLGCGYVCAYVLFVSRSEDFIARSLNAEAEHYSRLHLIEAPAELRFGAGKDDNRRLASGWNPVDADGVWSLENDARLVISVRHHSKDVRLRIHASPYVSDRVKRSELTVRVNGASLSPEERVRIDDPLEVRVPAAVARGGALHIAIHADSCGSPFRERIGEDVRMLCAALGSVEVMQ